MRRLREWLLVCCLIAVGIYTLYAQDIARLTPENAAQITEIETVSVPGMAAVVDMAVHQDGVLIAVADANGVLWLLDAPTQRPLFILEEQAITSVEFHPDGALLLLGGADGSLRVWGVPGISDAASDTVPVTLININMATQAELETLPNIGPVLAARIIEYRTLNGPFVDVAQLQNVSGIGPGVLEDVRPFVTVGID